MLASARRCLLLCAACGTLAGAAQLPDWYSRQLDDAEFEARMVHDVKQIERLVGDRLDGEFILIEMRVKALYGTHVVFDRDDFLMRSRRDNNMSTAQSPNRIAGDAVLAIGVAKGGASPTVFQGNPDGPIYGGGPGTGSRPRRVGGDDPGGIGGSVLGGSDTRTIEQRSTGDDTLAGRLSRLELPLEAHDETISGYLYFQIPAKVKRKHLELSYDGKFGEFLIEFKKPD